MLMSQFEQPSSCMPPSHPAQRLERRKRRFYLPAEIASAHTLLFVHARLPWLPSDEGLNPKKKYIEEAVLVLAYLTLRCRNML